MPAASSLSDLLRIRSHNREFIDRVNGNLGSALGFKCSDGESSGVPAILIFVPRKINNAWLSEQDRTPPTLNDGNGIECPTDVIQSISYDETYLKTYQRNGVPHADGRNIVSWSQLDGAPPLSRSNVELLQVLHGSENFMPAGARRFVSNLDGTGQIGTLGCLAKSKSVGA